MRILALESSCDETAAAVVEDGRRVLSSIVASQEAIHTPYGGVVPELASRAHLEQVVPVVDQALRKAGVEAGAVDAVAVVNRPGLIGALLVGVSCAKALAWALGKPLVAVDHIHAHLYAAALDAEESPFPAVGLVVSGGHTSLYHCPSPVDCRRLGGTTDDAAGEAFDKVAKLLGLGYPGGPAIDRLARDGDRSAVDLPRAYLEPGSLDFSFSGLKTAVLYRVKGHPPRRGRGTPAQTPDLTPADVADLAASFQEAVVDVIVAKALDACERTRERRLIVGGGVACNSRLRERLGEETAREGVRLCLPPKRHCPDNAAMVAGLAFHLLRAGDAADLALDARARS